MAGRQYPRSLGEFQVWFSTDADCLDYLEWLRWPQGFVCPGCGHGVAGDLPTALEVRGVRDAHLTDGGHDLCENVLHLQLMAGLSVVRRRIAGDVVADAGQASDQFGGGLDVFVGDQHPLRRAGFQSSRLDRRNLLSGLWLRRTPSRAKWPTVTAGRALDR
jgi:hypothetical protein